MDSAYETNGLDKDESIVATVGDGAYIMEVLGKRVKRVYKKCDQHGEDLAVAGQSQIRIS